MRIAVEATRYPYVGGLERLVEDLVDALLQRGHEILWITMAAGDKAVVERSRGGAPVHAFPFRTILEQKADPGRFLETSLAVRRRIIEFAPDMLHLHSCGPAVPFIVQALRRIDLPLLLTMHSEFDDTQLEQQGGLFRTMVARSDLVTAVSEQTLRRCREVFAIEPDRLILIRNALPRVQPTGPAPDLGRLLMLGRMVSTKGFDVVVRALPHILAEHPEARLVAGGEGPVKAEIAALAETLGVAHALDCVGWIDPDRVQDAMAASDVVIVPSRYEEPFGLVALEAAWAGRPVVASDVGGLREVVERDVTGLLVPPEDPAALAAATCRLLSDSATRARMGRAARLRAESQFGFEAMVDAYEAALLATVRRHELRSGISPAGAAA